MPLPERPNVREYVKLTDDLAKIKYALATARYNLDRLKAEYLKEAQDKGAKTRELDYVKEIGNNPTQKEKLKRLKIAVAKLERESNRLFGQMEAWRWRKELYISDSYHQTRG